MYGARYAGLQASQPPMGGDADGKGRQLQKGLGCNTHVMGEITPMIWGDNSKGFGDVTTISWGG